MPRSKRQTTYRVEPYHRPTREERDIMRKTRMLLNRSDKEGRTRHAREVAVIIRDLNAGDDAAARRAQEFYRQSRPPKKLRGTGEKIYSGASRSFTQSFSAGWWAKTGLPCRCAICHKNILATGTGADAPSIDHKKSWSEMKAAIDTHTVCCNGAHWEVVLTKDFRAEFQDESNLRPAHQGCNSSKGGSKNYDSIAPQKRAPCPGPRCGVTKAE